MRKPRRHYSSHEAVVDALEREFRTTWKKFVEVQNPPTTLYHYCTLIKFCKIIRSGKLWASDVWRMNDPDEITYPFNAVIGPLLNRRGNDGEPVYYRQGVKSPEVVKGVWGTWCTHIACLSATAEIPSQWEKYAECTGCAIGFNQHALERWCVENDISLMPMSYNQQHQQDMARQFLSGENRVEHYRLGGKSGGTEEFREELRSHADKYLASLAMTMKSDRWSDEKEWRILIIQTEQTRHFEPFSRPDSVCCFELPICTPRIVSDIVLAPRCRLKAEGVSKWLRRFGLNSVEVRSAQCECGDPSPATVKVGVNQTPKPTVPLSPANPSVTPRLRLAPDI